MKTKLYLLFLAAASGLASCVDDEGSYIYTKLNDVEVSGIDGSYTALAYLDNVTITPTVTGTLSGDDISFYDYTWYICNSNHRHDTISHEKDLDWKAEVPPGTHTLYLSVRDRQTGYDKLFGTTVNATSPFTRGFLILGNRPGSDLVGLDMLTMVQGRDTTYVEDVFDNSELKLRKAKNLVTTGVSYSKTRFFVTTEDETYDFTFTDKVQPTAELNQLGIIQPVVPHKRPMKLTHVSKEFAVSRVPSAMYPRIYLTEDLAFACRPLTSEFYSEPFNKYSATSEEYFRFYPLVFNNSRMNMLNTSGTTSSPIVLYDLDNDCFSYVTPYALNYVTAIQNNPSHGIWMNNRPYGRTMIYGENDYAVGKGNCYAIMKDNDGKHYLYRFQVGFSWSGLSITGNTYDLNINELPDFNNRSQMFFSSFYTLLYYSVGKTLYAYDYINKRLDKKEFEAEISYLAPEVASSWNASYGSTNVSDYWVATYNGNSGHLYKMRTTNNPNGIDFVNVQNQDWGVNLEVKSVLWKSGSGSY